LSKADLSSSAAVLAPSKDSSKALALSSACCNLYSGLYSFDH
jgi:hypothetical protein